MSAGAPPGATCGTLCLVGLGPLPPAVPGASFPHASELPYDTQVPSLDRLAWWQDSPHFRSPTGSDSAAGCHLWGPASPVIARGKASHPGSDLSGKEASGHFLGTLSFCEMTSKEYLSWVDFPSSHASKNLLSLREMEKKPALLHLNGQSCSKKPKCLMTSPVPHLPGAAATHTPRGWRCPGPQVLGKPTLTQWFSPWLQQEPPLSLPLCL